MWFFIIWIRFACMSLFGNRTTTWIVMFFEDDESFRTACDHILWSASMQAESLVSLPNWAQSTYPAIKKSWGIGIVHPEGTQNFMHGRRCIAFSALSGKKIRTLKTIEGLLFSFKFKGPEFVHFHKLLPKKIKMK